MPTRTFYFDKDFEEVYEEFTQLVPNISEFIVKKIGDYVKLFGTQAQKPLTDYKEDGEVIQEDIRNEIFNMFLARAKRAGRMGSVNRSDVLIAVRERIKGGDVVVSVSNDIIEMLVKEGVKYYDKM
jgi:hypothetical protein